MNILFFLIPKEEVAYVDESDSVRQVLEKMQHHGYTAIPVLNKQGKYIGSINEGDLLWYLKEQDFPDLETLESTSMGEIRRHRDNKPVYVHENMEGLFAKVINQNFVPVVDDDKIFIGIVTRRDVMMNMAKRLDTAEKDKK